MGRCMASKITEELNSPAQYHAGWLQEQKHGEEAIECSFAQHFHLSLFHAYSLV